MVFRYSEAISVDSKGPNILRRTISGADSARNVRSHSGFHSRAHFRVVVSCKNVREKSPDVKNTCRAVTGARSRVRRGPRGRPQALYTQSSDFTNALGILHAVNVLLSTILVSLKICSTDQSQMLLVGCQFFEQPAYFMVQWPGRLNRVK